MAFANEQKKDKKDSTRQNCGCQVVKNTVLISAAAVAVGALVYFTIKEGHRVKLENELLKYEVW